LSLQGVRAGGLTGDFIFGVFDILTERQQGEEFIAAGNASEGWNAEDPPERRAESVGVFWGDALEFEITADGTMGAKQMREWRGAGTETIAAAEATPRHVADNTSEIIKKVSSARPATIRRATSGAVHRS
jgi:hypothetical protein